MTSPDPPGAGMWGLYHGLAGCCCAIPGFLLFFYRIAAHRARSSITTTPFCVRRAVLKLIFVAKSPLKMLGLDLETETSRRSHPITSSPILNTPANGGRDSVVGTDSSGSVQLSWGMSFFVCQAVPQTSISAGCAQRHIDLSPITRMSSG